MGRRKKQRIRGVDIGFPLMIVVSVVYPCNFGCPMCPYTDENSEIRQFYKKNNAEFFPPKLWEKIADEAGPYGTWLRCTGGGEPLLHPQFIEMVEYAKSVGTKVWLNTNGSLLGPSETGRKKLERLIKAGVDLIEFSMDAGDPKTYAKLRPPKKGVPYDSEKWFNGQVSNIRAAIELRKTYNTTTRIVVSIIRQDCMEGKLEEAIEFYSKEVGVDDVITRKFLNWDDNTRIDLTHALDRHLYKDLPKQRTEPCVWIFERMNIDTLGRVALCGQDISFRTSGQFPNVWNTNIRDIWASEAFNWYRKLHKRGKGSEAWPCRNCSAWLAGIRDWDYGWLNVLKTTGEKLKGKFF